MYLLNYFKNKINLCINNSISDKEASVFPVAMSPAISPAISPFPTFAHDIPF